MKALLYIVVKGNEQTVQHIQEILRSRIQSVSFSPYREQASLKDCIEMNATFSIEQDEVDALLQFLDNDWDGEKDDCTCYGFNTKPFDPSIYFMRFECSN